MTPQMIETIAEPLISFLEGIKNEKQIETLKASLKFVLGLSNNSNFMVWAKSKLFNLWGVMEKNIDKSFVDMECIELAVQIHHNLLLSVDYARAFFEDSARTQQIAAQIFSLDLANDKWMRNIVVLSYLNPRGININYSSFLYKLNAALFSELEEARIDVSKVNSTVQLMRKFCTNIFKQENEGLIRQIIDLNLAKLMARTLKLSRSPENRQLDLKEVLSMLSLFVVDDEIVEFFLSSSVPMDLLAIMKEDRVEDKGAVVNLITVLLHMFRLKSYAFSKILKMDFLVYLFRHYERANEEVFKNDLLHLSRQVYDIKEFKKMLHDEETVIELKYRTDITQLDDLIKVEFISFVRRDDLETKDSKKKTDPDEWVSQFPKYKFDMPDTFAIITPDDFERLQNEDRLRVENDQSENVLLEVKVRKVQDFLTEIDQMKFENEFNSRIRKVANEFYDVRELISMRQENLIMRAKSKLSDLEKQNSTLRETIDSLQQQLKASSLGSRVPPRLDRFNEEDIFGQGTGNAKGGGFPQLSDPKRPPSGNSTKLAPMRADASILPPVGGGGLDYLLGQSSIPSKTIIKPEVTIVQAAKPAMGLNARKYPPLAKPQLNHEPTELPASMISQTLNLGNQNPKGPASSGDSSMLLPTKNAAGQGEKMVSVAAPSSSVSNFGTLTSRRAGHEHLEGTAAVIAAETQRDSQNARRYEQEGAPTQTRKQTAPRTG